MLCLKRSRQLYHFSGTIRFLRFLRDPQYEDRGKPGKAKFLKLGGVRTPSLHVKRGRPSSNGSPTGPTKHDLGRNGNLMSGRLPRPALWLGLSKLSQVILPAGYGHHGCSYGQPRGRDPLRGPELLRALDSNHGFRACRIHSGHHCQAWCTCAGTMMRFQGWVAENEVHLIKFVHMAILGIFWVYPMFEESQVWLDRSVPRKWMVQY